MLFSSGSGKTTLSKEFVIQNLKQSKKNLQLVLVNSDLADFKHFPATTSSVENLGKIPKQRIIVVEDIIAVSKKDEQILRLCLNKYAHHKLQKYFFISHSVFKTSIYGMLAFFNYIVIIKNETNLRNLKDILKYFRTEEKEFEQLVENFLSLCRQFPEKNVNQFFFYSTHLQKMFFCKHWHSTDPQVLHLSTLKTVNSTNQADQWRQQGGKNHGSGSEKKRKKNLTQQQHQQQLQQHQQALASHQLNLDNSKKDQILEQFEYFTSFYEKKNQAKIIFGIILTCLDEQNVRLNDLTYQLKNQKKNKIIISLVDYVTDLLEEKKHIKLKHRVLHHYIQSKCVIPDIFIINKNFKL